jgi:hypothetical protein
VVVDEDSSGEIGKSANLGQFTVGDSSSAADDCGDGVVPYHYSLGCRECQPADLGNDTTCKDAKRCPDEALSCVKPD